MGPALKDNKLRYSWKSLVVSKSSSLHEEMDSVPLHYSYEYIVNQTSASFVVHISPIF